MRNLKRSDISFTEIIVFSGFILFFLINWFKLFSISSLAPPDFYKYFIFSRRLFSGNLDLRNIPPLFPFLMGLSGRVLSVIPVISDPFVTGTKLLSLISSVGVISITFFFFKRLFNLTSSALASVFLISFPFFLKFSSPPLTDMPYLFLVVCSFYFLFFRKKGWSLAAVAISSLTRFEGILLFGSYIVNFVDIKLRKKITLLFYVFISMGVLTLFYYNFGMRIVEKLRYIIFSKSYLNFIKYPERIYSILMKNIAFFFRGNIFGIWGWLLFLLLISLFSYGVWILFRLNKKFTRSVILYMVLFTVAKGYISGVGNVFNGESQARRMLSVLYLFWIITVAGFIKLSEKLKVMEKGKIGDIVKIILLAVIILVIISLPFPDKGTTIITVVFILPLLFILFFRNGLFRIKKIVSPLVIFVLFLSFFNFGFRKSFGYVESLPNRGAYVIALWADGNLAWNERVAVYSLIPMLKYYMKKRVKLWFTRIKEENIYRNWKLLMPALIERMKRAKVRYIITDFYMNRVDSPDLVAVKRMLYRNRRGNEFLKFHKRLFYKGYPVALIFKVK